MFTLNYWSAMESQNCTTTNHRRWSCGPSNISVAVRLQLLMPRTYADSMASQQSVQQAKPTTNDCQNRNKFEFHPVIEQDIEKNVKYTAVYMYHLKKCQHMIEYLPKYLKAVYPPPCLSLLISSILCLHQVVLWRHRSQHRSSQNLSHVTLVNPKILTQYPSYL